MPADILHTPIEYLKGVGPVRADVLKKEAGIFTYEDLLNYYPFRHLDKTQLLRIRELGQETDYALLNVTVSSLEVLGAKRGRRMIATVTDGTGTMELVWFQGIYYVEKALSIGERIQIFGKVSFFMGSPQMTHPEFQKITADSGPQTHLEPVYPSTEKLRQKHLGGREISKLTAQLFQHLTGNELPENLPADILDEFRLISRWDAIKQIHFPADKKAYDQAVRRLKFEELFMAGLRILLLKLNRTNNSKGHIFRIVGDLFNRFYNDYIPFPLTNAQKRVLKEIRKDLGSGKQMNRLLQGDVGSGKTIVALLTMLIAADNGYQSCLMAPTEILARQHYENLKVLLKELPVNISILTGSTKAKERRIILEGIQNHSIHIIIGTHALVEDKVIFENLGLAIIDEQHKFGVAQRAKLWRKNSLAPHILVMTATPIPRTLALTVYGDLDYSVIDELPPGRSPVKTIYRTAYARPEVMSFVKRQIAAGRQAYFIYPLIEESEKLDYENLMKGYEEVKAFFPPPQYLISMVHGKQPADLKQANMDRFVAGNTQIMVSTTVIEVGVNVPNATVMVIESAERFGLPQLHQLRGRVGRGSEKSYCILLSGLKVSREAKERLGIMCQTTDGFKIAEKDMELRGPGDIEGTRQSGLLNFRIADIISDRKILSAAYNSVVKLLKDDPSLEAEENRALKQFISQKRGKILWSKIS